MENEAVDFYQRIREGQHLPEDQDFDKLEPELEPVYDRSRRWPSPPGWLLITRQRSKPTQGGNTNGDSTRHSTVSSGLAYSQ